MKPNLTQQEPKALKTKFAESVVWLIGPFPVLGKPTLVATPKTCPKV